MRVTIFFKTVHFFISDTTSRNHPTEDKMGTEEAVTTKALHTEEAGATATTKEHPTEGVEEAEVDTEVETTRVDTEEAKEEEVDTEEDKVEVEDMEVETSKGGSPTTEGGKRARLFQDGTKEADINREEDISKKVDTARKADINREADISKKVDMVRKADTAKVRRGMKEMRVMDTGLSRSQSADGTAITAMEVGWLGLAVGRRPAMEGLPEDSRDWRPHMVVNLATMVDK